MIKWVNFSWEGGGQLFVQAPCKANLDLELYSFLFFPTGFLSQLTTKTIKNTDGRFEFWFGKHNETILKFDKEPSTAVLSLF